MLLENTQTRVFVNIEGQFVDDRTQTSLQHRVLLRITERVVEHNQVGPQRVFVHLTDYRQRAHHEEQNGPALRSRGVSLTSHLNLLLRDLAFFDVFCDLH